MSVERTQQTAPVVVIGAGPAGLMAAWELVRNGQSVIIVEKAAEIAGLGGTTVFSGRHGDYRFDFGGHRFISHNAELLALVDDLLGDDLLTASRKSVIRLGGRTYGYPLALGNLLKTAPLPMLAGAASDGLRLLWRGARQQAAPLSDEASFADWITSRFGPTLYRTFFAGYTEKLWGISPRQLSADWAEQRISLVDLRDVLRRLLPGGRRGPRTYAHSYRYPRWGFGQLFTRLAERIEQHGGRLLRGTSVVGLTATPTPDGGQQVTAVQTTTGNLACSAVISTLPLPEMVRLTSGRSELRFRGLRFFNMPMQRENISDCTWQYLSDPDMLATRLQEPRRRSPFMAPTGQTSIMLEIPCDPGDRLWSLPDDQLWPLVANDLRRLGVDPAWSTGETFSVYSPHAYPLMDLAHRAERQRAFAHLQPWRNLVQCGRQGTFRYVFTDTAMEMGQMAARGLLAGEDNRQSLYDHRNERTVIEAQTIEVQTPNL